MKKKYGPTVVDVLAHYDKISKNLEDLENSEGRIQKLQAKRRALIGEITRVCSAMHKLRVEKGELIAEKICEVLRDLGMQKAQFSISVTSKTAFGPEGNDQVEFMISPNPGEAMKPLKRIASGGEMSRVMLAVKTVLADLDRTPTLIFDEVDAGVSGRTAQQVAEKLMMISRIRQILCITHLPQIAAMADTHFLIEKGQDGERTITTVHAQGEEEIIQELARLIGGAKITESTTQAAGEMKVLADQLKEQQGQTANK